MQVPSVEQAVAAQEWAVRALNTDDLGVPIIPAPFADEVVYIGERDHPRALRFCRLATISLIAQGPAARTHQRAEPLLLHHAHDQREWTVSMTVVVRQSSVAPSMADSAGIHMERALGWWEGPLSTAQAGLGIDPLRRADVTDAARVASSAAWETRVVATLVWICGRVNSISVGWVEQVTGTGQVDGLDPLPFDSNLAGP